MFLSASSGGPYVKVNSSRIFTNGRASFTVGGLENGRTDYIVAKMIDTAGNQSAFSSEVSVTPAP